MTLPIRQPMLAPSKVPDITKLRYPLYASNKLDGIRCLIINNELYSRSGKLIPNKNLRTYCPSVQQAMRIAKDSKWVLDGELYGDYTFQDITSIVMSKETPIDATRRLGFWSFDAITFDEWTGNEILPLVFSGRIDRLYHSGILDTLHQTLIWDSDQLQDLYDLKIREGYEGLILRDPHGKYKHGRCTLKEHNMFKMKAVDEMDVVVVGYEPLREMTSDAVRERDELGHLKPIHRQGERYETEKLGALIVTDESGRTFNVGSGFTLAQRIALWKEKDTLIGRWAKVKSLSAGVKDLPRCPVFLSWRDPK